MIIRRWKKSDNDEISIMESQSFSDPWDKAMLDSCFETDTFYGLVAEENEKILGYVGAVYLFENADIVNVCVGESYRRRGIANTLLKSLTEQLKEKVVSVFFLEVRRSNFPAISLYEKFGFELMGVRKRYYEGTEDALIYRLVL